MANREQIESSYCALRKSCYSDGRVQMQNYPYDELTSRLENNFTQNPIGVTDESSFKHQELCQPNCWCNNLVEINCRNATKVTSYVVLVENSSSSTHSINMNIFNNLLKLKKISEIDSIATQLLEKKSNFECDLRRNSTLSRISESNSGQENVQDNFQSNLESSKPELQKSSVLSARKSSFDYSTTGSVFGASPLITNSSTTGSGSSGTMFNSIDPSQVFLQLFEKAGFNEKDGEQPILIPSENESIKRTLNILDYLPCYLTHKIGVAYIGPNQANDEKAILSNANGSIRYRNFVRGLGNLVCLKNMDTLRFYPGGLETDGSLGDFTLLWYDGIIQVVFHVSTMMILKDDDINSKKRHIGNDSCLIVYNESGEEYQFGMIKGEVNCICIEIIPLKDTSNIIKVKTTSEFTQSSCFIHSDPKFVSDQNLSLIVRKMALHADLAAKVIQKDNINQYGGKWYERLKKIKRIKNMSKDHYAKQALVQQQQQQQQLMKTLEAISKQTSIGQNVASSNLYNQNQPSQSIEHIDFTEYI